MDLPEVRVGSRREATVPLGNAESLKRLRERTEDRKPQTDPVRGMSERFPASAIPKLVRWPPS